MPHIDPIVRFWIGVAVTIAIGISQGALNLTHAVPDVAIPAVTAWAAIIAFGGSAFLTALNGAASTNSSRLASAASIPQVTKIEVTPAMVSHVDQDKVVVAGSPTAVEAAAAAAAPAAAAVAAPPAAAVAAPPAAEIAVEHALAERDKEHKS